jgi:hypothetical protein
MAWCAAEIKPSNACLACSTLFSANARISGGTSKRSFAAMVISSCDRVGCDAHRARELLKY